MDQANALADEEHSHAMAINIQRQARVKLARLEMERRRQATKKAARSGRLERNPYHPTDRELMSRERCIARNTQHAKYWDGRSSLDESTLPEDEAAPDKSLKFSVTPQGARPITLNSLTDAKHAYFLLAGEDTKKLNRTDARTWLQCMGWCVPNEKLDELLNGDKPSKLEGQWSFFTLSALAAHQSSSGSNGGLEELKAALLHMSRDTGKMGMDKLIKITASSSELVQNIGDIMKLIGAKPRGTLSTEKLAEQVMDWIVHPPAYVLGSTSTPTHATARALSR